MADALPQALDDVVQEFVERWRRGDRAAVADYAARHPEHAEQLRALLPAAVALEGLKTSLGTASATAGGGLAGPVPELLGSLRIVREIGRGGMGIVYEAEELTLQRRVAVKVLPASVASSSRRERFRREALTASKLHHTHIVPIFGVGAHEGHEYYVMQRIDGVGLDRVIAALAGTGDASGDELTGRVAATLGSAAGAELRGRSDYQRRVAQLGRQASTALQHAHQHGVLHRDVKPSNLLLDADGRLWVADFGLAKGLDDDALTLSGDLVGTLRYMAPEQTRGSADARSDVYGLGLVLYEMLALQPAFTGSARAEVVQRVLAGALPPLRRIDPRVPEDLARVVHTACAREPADRYATAAALGDDLLRFIEGRPIHARRLHPLLVAWRWCRRNPAVASLSVAAVVLLAAGLLVAVVGKARTEAALRRTTEANLRVAANLDLSMRALDELFERISGPDPMQGDLVDPATGDVTVVNAVVLAPDDAALLRRISEFYEAFANANADHPTLRQEAARARRRIGDIELRTGDVAAALASYERAAAFEDDAAAADTAAAVERARVANGRGRALALLGRAEQARAAHQAALDGLAGCEAEAVEATLEAVGAHHGLVQVRPFGRGGRRGNAGGGGGGGAGGRRRAPPRDLAEHLDAAWTLLEGIPAAAAEDPRVLLARARTQALVARLQPSSAGQQQRAAALEALSRLVVSHPDAQQYRFELASGLLDSGRRRRGGAGGPASVTAERRAEIERAAKLARELVAEAPAVADYAALAARAEFELGVVEDDPEVGLRRMRVALAAVAVTPGPRQVAPWSFMAMRLARRLQELGRTGEVAAVLRPWLEHVEQRAAQPDASTMGGLVRGVRRSAELLAAAGEAELAARARALEQVLGAARPDR